MHIGTRSQRYTRCSRPIYAAGGLGISFVVTNDRRLWRENNQSDAAIYLRSGVLFNFGSESKAHDENITTKVETSLETCRPRAA